MFWFPAEVKCSNLSTVNTFQYDHLLGKTGKVTVFFLKNYFYFFWAGTVAKKKVFQDEGIYIWRNKTKRYCNGICELHLPWGIYYEVQFIFYYISLM